MIGQTQWHAPGGVDDQFTMRPSHRSRARRSRAATPPPGRTTHPLGKQPRRNLAPLAPQSQHSVRSCLCRLQAAPPAGLSACLCGPTSQPSCCACGSSSAPRPPRPPPLPPPSHARRVGTLTLHSRAAPSRAVAHQRRQLHPELAVGQQPGPALPVPGAVLLPAAVDRTYHEVAERRSEDEQGDLPPEREHEGARRDAGPRCETAVVDVGAEGGGPLRCGHAELAARAVVRPLVVRAVETRLNECPSTVRQGLAVRGGGQGRGSQRLPVPSAGRTRRRWPRGWRPGRLRSRSARSTAP